MTFSLNKGPARANIGMNNVFILRCWCSISSAFGGIKAPAALGFSGDDPDDDEQGEQQGRQCSLQTVAQISNSAQLSLQRLLWSARRYVWNKGILTFQRLAEMDSDTPFSQAASNISKWNQVQEELSHPPGAVSTATVKPVFDFLLVIDGFFSYALRFLSFRQSKLWLNRRWRQQLR